MTAIAIPVAHRGSGRRRIARGRWTTLVALVMVPLVFGVGATWAYWMANSTAGSNGASAATSVNAGNTPTASAVGATVTVSWSASTLAAGQAVTGYQVKRYDATTLALQTILSACTGTVAATSCVESSVPAGSWKYSVTPVFATNWVGAESAKSSTVIVDTTGPTGGSVDAVGLVGTGTRYSTSTTLSIALNKGTDPNGVAATGAQLKRATATLTSSGGTANGACGSYGTYTLITGGTDPVSPKADTVTDQACYRYQYVVLDTLGNSTTYTSGDIKVDTTAPSAGSVTYADGTVSGTTLSVSFTAGTDAASGIGTRLLQRASATLTNGTCGTFGAFATVTNGTNPTSPVVDAVSRSNCYMYQYLVANNAGATQTATNANVAKAAYGAYWAFDAGSGTTAIDSTGNGNTGTLQATAGWTTGKVGAGALNLNGTSTSVVTTSGPVIDSSQSYTVTAWVKVNNLTGFQTFASMDGNAISPFYLQMNSSSRFAFTQRNSDSTTSVETSVVGPVPTVGVWYQVTGVYNKELGYIELFVNGVSQGTALYSSGWKANGGTTIGRAKWNGAGVDLVNGALDEVHFYDRVLTQAEITNLASVYASTIGATSGLSGYWRLGEASGTTIVDSFGTNHGTYVGTPTLGVAGAISGDANTAVTFNGTNQYGTVARQVSGDFSIEFWFKSTQNYSGNDYGQAHCSQWWQGAGLVDADTSGGANDFGVSLCEGKVIAGVGSPELNVVSAAGYNNGNWHYVVFKRTQATGVIELYVDGVSAGTVTAHTNPLNATPTINFGRSAPGVNYFAGSLDEIAIYGTALSAGTVAAHYALTPAVNDAPVNSVPGAQSVSTLGTKTFSSANGNLVSISDIDANGAAERVTLTSTNGTMTLSGTTGLTFTVGDGNDDTTMTFSGTIAAINAALAGMVYDPNFLFLGSASLQIITNDLGNTGTPGPLSDTDTVAITVTAI